MKSALKLLPAAAAILAAVAFLAGRPGAPDRPDSRAPRPEPRLERAASERIVDAPANPLPVDPGPVQWKSLIDRLRRSLDSMSDVDLLDARVKLAKLLEENPEKISELLAVFERETNEDVLLILAEVIGGDPAAMSNPALVETMIRLSDSGAVPAQRGAALMVLMHLSQLDDRATAVVLRLAGADGEHRDLRITAISTVVAWMQQHPDGEGPLSKSLLGIARSAADDEVRGHAIQGVALLSRPADAETVDSAALILRDPNSQNRALAAMTIGSAGADSRVAAVRHLEGALDAEKMPDVQRGMLIHLVRAAGPEAEATLTRAAQRNPRLLADVQDYLDILKSTTDPMRIWEIKQERDLARGEVPGAQDHSD